MSTTDNSGDESMLQILIKHYGPNVLPLVMFMAIWFTAVQPVLNKRDTSIGEHREVIKQMGVVCSTMERTSATLERIAIMRGVVDERDD